MYRHIKSYELRYTDVDAYDSLKLSSLLSFLEESACLSADELGFGYDDLQPRNFGFIIANWYIELRRNLKLGEIISVHTWPLKPSKLIFLRDFEIYAGNEKVGVATTRWCMINTQNFQFLPASAYFEEKDFENYNTERSIDFSAWKIPSIKEGREIYSRQVRFSDYDHYFHVNNTKYADFLTDVYAVGEMKDKYIYSVQITYVKQCKEGEILSFSKASDGEFDLVEGKVDGELRVQMRIKFGGV